ncbi:uncharacterized protein LOC129751448 [Uranotaenia lowii]|uniref:uncharacterized protein LOC129751448 n=1 Tax=Uranotaenia lowii TaxID=190385 RepID=UPI002479960F|nr:uncharacterized protein LOC129751448 [Uranotaenia lowii]
MADVVKTEEKAPEVKPTETSEAETKPTEEATEVKKEETTEGDKPKEGDKAADAEKPKSFDTSSLNTSSKKRFYWLVEQGYSKEEALKLAPDAAKVAELRAKVNLKRKSETTGGSAAKQTKTEKIIVAVAHPDYPSAKITSEQAGKIKSAILKKVLDEKDTGIKPNFEECVFTNDYLRVTCSDSETFTWLKAIIGTLELWEGASLSVSNERKLQNIGVYNATFEDSKDESNEQIFDFIQSQNTGFDTGKWKIVSRKDIPSTTKVTLTFTMDPQSIKPLKDVDYNIKYKFGKVQIYKKDRETGKIFIPTKKVANAPKGRPQQNVWSSAPGRVNPKSGPQSRGRPTFNASSNRGSNFRNRSGPPNPPPLFRGNSGGNPIESLFEQFNRLNNLANAARGGNFPGNNSSGGNFNNGFNGGNFNRGGGGGGRGESLNRSGNSGGGRGGSGFNNRGGNPNRNNNSLNRRRNNPPGGNRIAKRSKPF